MKAAVCSAIDAAKADKEKLAQCIENEPELGFKEAKAAKKWKTKCAPSAADDRCGTLQAPGLPKTLAASPALILQEFGNLAPSPSAVS